MTCSDGVRSGDSGCATECPESTCTLGEAWDGTNDGKSGWRWLGEEQFGVLMSHGKTTGLRLRDLDSVYDLVTGCVTLGKSLIFSEN